MQNPGKNKTHMKEVTIRVPATSANLGSAFDSAGIALNLYNYVSAARTEKGLNIIDVKNPESHLPKDKTNLVYQAINTVAKNSGNRIGGLEIKLLNNIPSSRGLGSSSAAIVGGLMAGNALCDYPFTKKQLLYFAAELEGHADNVTPALYGGFTVSVTKSKIVRFIKNDLKDDIKFAVFVPDFSLRTKRSRMLLPRIIPFRDAVFNTGRSALLAASLISGDYTHLKTAVSDRMHQNYRKKLIPGFEDIFRLAYRCGALGVYLSGAGPSILAIVKSDNLDFNAKISGVLNKKHIHWQLQMLNADNEGATEVNKLEVL